MYNRLKDTQKQTGNLSTHVNNVQEQERLRQVSNLYEELGQELNTLRMDLWLLRQKSKKIGKVVPHSTLLERLAATSRLIGTTIQSVRKISRDIKPLIIDEVGVAAAIE